jgi:hypothetical protein
MVAALNERSEVQKGARRRLPQAQPMALTARDQEVVSWIYQAHEATREQLQRLFFSITVPLPGCSTSSKTSADDN